MSLKELRAAEKGGRRDGRRRKRWNEGRDERTQHCGTAAVCLLHICSQLNVYVGCRLVWNGIHS